MSVKPFRHRPAFPRERRNVLSSLFWGRRNRLKWRQHRPSADRDRLAPPSSRSSPSGRFDSRGDFLSLSPRRRDSARMVVDTNRTGKALLVVFSIFLLLIVYFF